MSLSISRSKKNTYYINKYWKWMKNIWKFYRWELFVILSVIALILCYFFTHQEEYKGFTGLNDTSQDPLKKGKKGKRVPKKHETECRRIVEDIFKTPFSSVRPNFLKNPKTGKNLELDMYSPPHKLAIEYQGAQHRTYTPFFHESYTDFLDQVERDNYKKQRCIEEGIDLICVPDNIKFEDLRTYIIKELQRLRRIT